MHAMVYTTCVQFRACNLCTLWSIILAFNSGHVIYARYGLYYLRSIQGLPQNVLKCFMTGELVMRHIPGVCNVICSGIFIESMFMRYGHGKRRIIYREY